MVNELFAHLCVRDADAASRFYQAAFEATESFRLTEPSGRIGHLELSLGGTNLLLAEEFPEYGITGPRDGGGTPVSIHIHVDDADAVIARAVAAGATLEMEPKDQFYGERSGAIRDPQGHRWTIGHAIERLSPDEMQRRYTELMKDA
jgi:uncharacterized glyoxalase superfamily protein PhnB